MALPVPEPGLVIRFNYLWRREQSLGRENARYPRPCAVVLSHRRAADGLTLVVVAAVTHTPPAAGARAVELPPRVKQSLGLDDARSWVVTDEVNEFVWPGFDLAPTARGDVAYGLLPPRLYETIRLAVLEAARAGRLGRVRRGG
jgi:mRNA-degrading endonuclease toxin of MazEF toxin-antitoxin module